MGEYVNTDLLAFFSAQGTIHQTTCPYTPQQNGRVERKHRNLLKMTRALRFQANLHVSFWGDCLLASTYLINRIPTSVLGFVSPYEKLFLVTPSYNHLRTFGYLAYMSIHTSDKLVPRALKTVFIGYHMHQKGYMMYDLSLKQLIFQDMLYFMRMFFLFLNKLKSYHLLQFLILMIFLLLIFLHLWNTIPTILTLSFL